MKASSNLLSVIAASAILGAAGQCAAADCHGASIQSPTPFMGLDGEVFKLNDGSLWEVKFEYEYLYAYYPSVVICPGAGKLIIGEKALAVQRVGSSSNVAPSNSLRGSAPNSEWQVYEKTSLQGTISGTVQAGSVFKTLSGNVYEVTGLTLQLVLELQPNVIVLRSGSSYKLIVDGFDEPLICKRLN